MDTVLVQKSRARKQQQDHAEQAKGEHGADERPEGAAAGMPLYLQGGQAPLAPVPLTGPVVAEQGADGLDRAGIVSSIGNPTERARQLVGNGRDNGIRPAATGEPEQIAPIGGLSSRPSGHPPSIQARLLVNEPGDDFEQEADAVAQRAVAHHAAAAPPDNPGEDRRVQRSALPGGGVPMVFGSPARLTPPSGGSQLNPAVREHAEHALGADLGSVRVHSGLTAQQTASALNAKAFTQGNDIWLGPGQSADDVSLIAHEATHVVQQSGQKTGDRPIIQRRPEDYAHTEDGSTVQKNMGSEVDGALADAGDRDGEETPVVTPAERASRKAELAPHSHPPADRAAEARPQTTQAAAEIKTESAQPSEPLAESAEQHPQGKGEASLAADTAASAAAAADGASTPAAPSIPPQVVPPAPVLPVNAEGQNVQADPIADDASLELAGQVQRMRNEGLIARQRAAALRGNATRLQGNLAIAHAATDTAEQGLTSAHGHMDSRRQIAAQARSALSVSEEKAAKVAAEAPEYAARATTTHEDSGPMATGAQEQAGAARGNVPDDEEAAEKMQDSAAQMESVSTDATSVDSAVTGTQARGEALVAEAAQAAQKNTATSTKLDATDEAIAQTDTRLTEMDGQNETARAQIAGVAKGPAQLNAGAASIDAQAEGIISASCELERQLQAAQDDFSADMRTVPGTESLTAVAQETTADTLPPFIQRDAQSAYGDRISVDVLGSFGLRSPPTAAALAEQQERATRAAERRRARLREINDRAAGHFENLSAIDKAGIALDITAENLMGDLGDAKWPHILGQMALAFVDPTVSLEGVVSGLNMTLSGASNLFSAQQWARDPLGNLLKSAADIATGLTIILGSIAGLCTAILVILGALAIITFGAMGPAFLAASAFLGPIITTVGGWAISCAAIAAELQFFVLIKNLVDAGTASTAEELEHESDQMTEDATQAGNMAAQVVVAGVMEAGGAVLAETAVGQRLGAAATSIGERFDMIPPPRGTPVLEPGAAAIPDSPVTQLEGVTAPPEPGPGAAPLEASPAPLETPAPLEASTPPDATPSGSTVEAPPAEASTAPPEAPPAPVSSPEPATAPATEPPSPPPSTEPAPAPAQEPTPTPEPSAPEQATAESPAAKTAAQESAPPAETTAAPEAAAPEATAPESPAADASTEPAPAPERPMTAAERRAMQRLREIFQDEWGLEGAALEKRLSQVRGDPEAALRDLVGRHPRLETPLEDVPLHEHLADLDEGGPRDTSGIPDETPENSLFDDPNAEPVSPDKAREAYMGKTPSKYSETGAAVVERMRAETPPKIRGEGPLLPGNPNKLEVMAPDKTWHLIDEKIDMAHISPNDAVRWWNAEGRFYGARSKPVREFMIDPDNYRLVPRGPNRSDGAKIGETYLPPEK